MGQARLRANEIATLKANSVKLGDKYVTPLLHLADEIYEGKTPFQFFLDSEFHQAAIELQFNFTDKPVRGFVYVCRNKDSDLAQKMYKNLAEQAHYDFSFYCPLNDVEKAGVMCPVHWERIDIMVTQAAALKAIGANEYLVDIGRDAFQLLDEMGEEPDEDAVALYGKPPSQTAH